MNPKDIYIALCDTHDVPLFLQHWWLDATGADWDVAITRNGQAVAGVWPYTVERKAGIFISRNPQLTPYLGPHIFFPADLKESKRDNFEHETIRSLAGELPPLKSWAVALQPGLRQAGLFRQLGFSLDVRQTFIMDLAGHEEEAIFSRLHEDFRRNIRKAAGELQITEEPEALPQLYQFQEATLRQKSLHMHYSFPYMQRLFDACRSRGQAALWVARKDGQAQALLWHMWDKTRAYYLVGAKNPDVRDNRSVTALIWHAIRHSKALGKATFDFEGSMDPGVEGFFRHFGARRELYFTLMRHRSLRWKLIRWIRG